MFFDCDKLIEVSIPTSIESIGKFAFYCCSSLAKITIPSSVTLIKRYAFYGCSSLTEVKIPSSVTLIGKSAFEECLSLSSINIPSSVNMIGEYCFFECHSLVNIEIPSSILSIDNSTFRECSNLSCILLSPNLEKIGDHCFEGCVSLKEILIPPSVKEIGCFAFNRCSSLNEFIIPSIVTIEPYTFANCSSLKKIEIPNSVVSIRNFSFNHCSLLEDVLIPESVIFIGEHSFNPCNSLKNVTISSSKTEIEDKAFQNNVSLTFMHNLSFVNKLWNYLTFQYQSIFQSSSASTTIQSPSASAIQSSSINNPSKSRYIIDIKRFKNGLSYESGKEIVKEIETDARFLQQTEYYLSFDENMKIIEKLTEKEIRLHINANHPTINKFYGYSFQFTENKYLKIICDITNHYSLYKLLQSIRECYSPTKFNNTNYQKIVIGIARALKYLQNCKSYFSIISPNDVILDENYYPKIVCSIYNKSLIMNQLHNYPISVEDAIYLAPELFEDSFNCVNEKPLVYSFGIIMFEIYTLKNPLNIFEHIKSGLQVFESKRKMMNNLDFQCTNHINESIRNLIRQCLSQNPIERPSFKEIFQKLAYDENYYLNDVDVEEINYYVDEITNE